MAQQLKTTGLATDLVWFIGVDRDTDAIKDYCSSSVTADLQIGANVTKGDLVWKSNTRRYFKLGAGTATADFMDCGTTKPSFVFNADGQQRTLVWIGKAAGNGPRAFGGSTTSYLAGHDVSSGSSTYPAIVVNSVQRNGGNTRLSAGTKAMFGALLERGASGTTKVFWALESDSAVTISAEKGAYTTTGNYSPARWGGINGSTTKQQDEIGALMCFDRLLTQGELDALLADYEGELLEAAGGGTSPVEQDYSATRDIIASVQQDFAASRTIGDGVQQDFAATRNLLAAVQQDLAATRTILGPAGVSLNLDPDHVLRNNTTSIWASTEFKLTFYRADTDAFVVNKTVTTNASGLLGVVTDAALTAGVAYDIKIKRTAAPADMGILTATAA